MARASGLPLDLSRQPFTYPTNASHTLVRLARARGTQHGLAVALSRAYFLLANNISDPEVLGEIASDHGFEATEARRLSRSPAELSETRRAAAVSAERGVRSVPHFVFNDAISLNGSQSEDALAAAIEQASKATTPSGPPVA